MTVSAVSGDGLAEAWGQMQALAGWRKEHGHWERRRAEQARGWFDYEVRQGLLARLTSDHETRARMARLGDAVAAGETSVTAAAEEMLGALGLGLHEGGAG
jgi:LAO/AO transport system kinase